MVHFKGKYLRVTTPVTTNGLIQKLDERGQALTEETFLPLTAQKDLEKNNRHLERTGAPHLKAKVEVVG